ncbi:MAG: hypothetical protein KA042_17495 [Saprospiraceae bacterium]|nr:hypothetical protein [Saprospiraceae bacterium]
MNKKSDSNVAVEAREIFMPDWPGDIHSLNAANKVQPQITCSKSTIYPVQPYSEGHFCHRRNP